VGYTDADRERWVREDPVTKRADRDDFARDRARLLHSASLRRLSAKTQVVQPGDDDFVRNRLTHSLEVAQIGREFGAALGCSADVVDTACLAHDLGHPPFGHNGEQALDAVAVACGGFEGNAQTLRVLTRLEAKIIAADGESAGLNLTRAVLDATCKYPWERVTDTRKFGVYDADLDAFAWLRKGAPDRVRCLEAQIMDWADDVAYSVHDLEDGVQAGLVRLAGVDDTARETLCRLAAEHYSTLSADQLAPVLDELLEMPTLTDLADYDGTYRAQAAAKRATSELVGRFAGAAVAATRAAHGSDPLHRYEASLVVPTAIAAECALLKAIALHYVMRRPGAAARQAEQRQLLIELVDAIAHGAPGTLDRGLLAAWRSAESEGDRLRVVIDQVAQLTDSSAVLRHARLSNP